jgi:hypothetical protein
VSFGDEKVVDVIEELSLSNQVSQRKQGCFEIEKYFSPAADVSSRRSFDARVFSAWMIERAFTTPSQPRSSGYVFPNHFSPQAPSL